MLRLPLIVADDYRSATDREVRSWSFGLVRAPRRPGADSWQARLGTLDDERTFGPLRDLRCACGRYRGADCRNMICDICGVKVTTAAARRERFGHLELARPVPHPFGAGGEVLSAVPVLPAAFRASPAGREVGGLYEEILRATGAEAGGLVERLSARLLPAAVHAFEWGLAEREVFARALALERRVGPRP
jgi:hypothetical protein